MRHAGDVIARARLVEQLWNTDLIGIDNLIDAHISNVRRKVDPPSLPALIHTVRGRGFRRRGHLVPGFRKRMILAHFAVIGAVLVLPALMGC